MPTRAKAEQRRRDERLEAADADDVETMLELLGDQADGVLKMLRQWQAAGGDPPTHLIEAARECRYYAVDCLNLGAGGDQEVDQERILGVVDRAVFGEEPATAAERAGEGRSPRQILRELRDVLRPAVARCAARYGKGEQQTSHATSAIKEFRLLSSTIRQLNATTRDDTDLDLLLSQTPGRLPEIDALATVGFVPPLEPDRSVPDLS